MAPSYDSAAKSSSDAVAAALRALPSVDELLGRPRIAALVQKSGRKLVTSAIRTVLSDARKQISTRAWGADGGTVDAKNDDELESLVVSEVENILAPSLRRVINATGVVLHTNLGRAPLARQAVARIVATAPLYNNLEYDLARGERGKRDAHTSRLLAELCGTEAAIVVNNNAAAVLLVLHALAKGEEVIVSRGELIEIGDGFRIPEIMAESGAVLREVGTTNRTGIRDYEDAINDRTRLLLRVHPSNFRVTGFTDRPSLEELVALGKKVNLPVYEDLGSGCLADLTAAGILEPVVRSSGEAGVSVMSFSGDKLLGGPQAGMIAGKKEIVDRIRRNPLFRALRVDKLTIAALEVTLKSYLRGALDEIPALRMIRLSAAEIGSRAEQLLAKLRPLLPDDVAIQIREGVSVIGGGSTPDQSLPTSLIAIASPRISARQLEENMRRPELQVPGPGKSISPIPVIGRIEDEQLILDLRTVQIEEEPELIARLAAALS
ncbi:MAG: L-seryl-tRNA(Sec) selenium transferase [Candidatus Acidiferrales bacterium]|jgi:L-seryl-tRNA(Ser) seleniumtransferase